MIIEISITARSSKYDELAKTELTLDSDDIDRASIATLTVGMAKSIIDRAEKKPAKRAEPVPVPLTLEPEAKEPASF